MSFEAFTTHEWEQKIGDQIRSLRLRLNMEQTTVAEQAGISVSAFKNLESGKGASLKTLIKVLRVFNREDWFTALAPQITVSPLQMLAKKAPRQRARRKKVSDV